jgi:hypothetical protein
MTSEVAAVLVAVSVDIPPAATEVGFAVRVTLGGTGVTVIVTVAVALAPGTVAVAVYVVVEAGVTDCVPPVAETTYRLPSDPVIATAAAFEALILSIDAVPATITVGFAVSVTAGPRLTTAVLTPEPHPVTTIIGRTKTQCSAIPGRWPFRNLDNIDIIIFSLKHSPTLAELQCPWEHRVWA